MKGSEFSFMKEFEFSFLLRTDSGINRSKLEKEIG